MEPKGSRRSENLGLQMSPKDKLTSETLGAWQKAGIDKCWPLIANAKVIEPNAAS